MKQGSHFAGAIIEEARACLFGVRTARDCCHLNLIVEGDCLPLINKLSSRVSEETTLSLIISDILDVTKHFNFVSFSFVKQGGNQIAHAVAHWQPWCYNERIWSSDASRLLMTWPSEEMYAHIDRNLI